MFGLYISLALLGLSAVDPVGIGIMPVLLTQSHPYRRVAVFLSGSFVSLMIMGLAFSKGLGSILLRFEQRNHWFVPCVEVAAAAVLFGIAAAVYFHSKKHKSSAEPSKKILSWLELSNLRLFILGAGLVAVQSVLDVVFVIAMIRVGQYKLANISLIAAVATYALAALIIQIALIGTFWLAPANKKTSTLVYIRKLIKVYADRIIIAISLILGCLLLIAAL